jgi:hypothetical protein
MAFGTSALCQQATWRIESCAQKKPPVGGRLNPMIATFRDDDGPVIRAKGY